jgi:hypothetical protein
MGNPEIMTSVLDLILSVFLQVLVTIGLLLGIL